jgi:hypothetical protein
MSNKYKTIDEVCQACNAWAGPKRTWNTGGHWAKHVPLTYWNPCSPDLHESGVMHMLFRGTLPRYGKTPFTAEDFALLLD